VREYSRHTGPSAKGVPSAPCGTRLRGVLATERQGRVGFTSRPTKGTSPTRSVLSTRDRLSTTRAARLSTPQSLVVSAFEVAVSRASSQPADIVARAVGASQPPPQQPTFRQKAAFGCPSDSFKASAARQLARIQEPKACVWLARRARVVAELLLPTTSPQSRRLVAGSIWIYQSAAGGGIIATKRTSMAGPAAGGQ